MKHIIPPYIRKHGSVFIEDFLIAGITIGVFILTVQPHLKPFVPLLFIICALVFVGWYCLHRLRIVSTRVHTGKLLTFAVVVMVLLWIGMTGWFFSPYFYFLYVLCVSLVFIFQGSVAFSFVLVLIGVLLPQIGSTDIQFDTLSLVALLIIVPLTYYLRKEYLLLIQKDKKILILQKENKVYKGIVDEVLSNKIHKSSVEIRQPISDIKQLALYLKKYTPKDKQKYIDRIIESSHEALGKLREFEENTTGNKMRKTP